MKRTKKNRQADCLQTDTVRKRPAATSARMKAGASRSLFSWKHRKSKRGNVYTSAEKFMRKSLSLPVGWETV